MDEYQKAMLLIAMSQTALLHRIAKQTAQRDRVATMVAEIDAISGRLLDDLIAQTPTVAALLTQCSERPRA